ncbi:hypothetical protein JTE90_027200 [Oedothorax gibbosus]|uniref:Uncharacterized protein n=1 Tax=Oedothorax gibbosus TaxID=931172 RepID=A0AAV6U6J9_9ARAC|nr:hypothetical protein JTE90_027200 [Oedothorax gibbosus]
MLIQKVSLLIAFFCPALEFVNPPHHQPPAPVPIDPVIDVLATSISHRLRHSAVLGHFANFKISKPYDAFYEAGTYMLHQAGYYDPDLVKVVANAVEKVGTVTSELFFDALGGTIAKIWLSHGAAEFENAEALALSFANAVEVAACVAGLVDTKSVVYAVVDGILNIFEVYKYTDYDDLVNLFNLYAGEIQSLGETHASSSHVPTDPLTHPVHLPFTSERIEVKRPSPEQTTGEEKFFSVPQRVSPNFPSTSLVFLDRLSEEVHLEVSAFRLGMPHCACAVPPPCIRAVAMTTISTFGTVFKRLSDYSPIGAHNLYHDLHGYFL